jgi:hypothetical protein
MVRNVASKVIETLRLIPKITHVYSVDRYRLKDWQRREPEGLKAIQRHAVRRANTAGDCLERNGDARRFDGALGRRSGARIAFKRYE